jgi:hypothetical protein
MQFIDNIKTRAQTGNYETHGDIVDADCVIGFSFGFRKNGTRTEPGLSNQDMARLIYKLSFELPTILQFEIADGLPSDAKKDNVFRIEAHRKLGAYLDSREVADQAKTIMKAHDWHKALIVAHPYHVPRVDALCKKLGIDTIVPPTLGVIRFDPESEQERTQSIENWLEYEPKAIDRDAARGWI